MKPKLCPDPDTLRLLLIGKIPAPARDQWDEHLLNCESCAELAATVNAGDDLTAARRAEQILREDEDTLADIVMRGKKLQSELDTIKREETQGAETQGAGPAGLDLTTVLKRDRDGLPADQVQQQVNNLAPAEQDDELGRLGGYRILNVMGVGGMGIVYRAEDPILKRPIALKVMKPEVAVSKTARERFIREAQAAAAVDHDNIITIHQVGEDRGTPFIAMKYLRGESLETRLRSNQRLVPIEVANIGRQVALGLDAAHHSGLVHRDIKPDNIWLESRDLSAESNGSTAMGSRHARVKILDFGLVRSHDDDANLTQSGVVMGTPKYMSPEQANAEAIDYRSDLFSLGSVLYHLVTGKAPFQGGNLTATLIKVSQADCEPIQQHCPDLDEQLAALIERLLARDPASRPQTDGEVAEQLAEIEKRLEAEQAEEIRQRCETETTEIAAPVTSTPAKEPSSLVKPGSSAAKRSSLVPAVIVPAVFVAVALAFFGLWMAGFFVRVETEHGTLVVQVLNEDFSTSVLGKTITIRNSESGATYIVMLDKPQKSETLSPGDYEFSVTNDDGFRTLTNRFEIVKGTNKQVNVWWEDSAKTAADTPASGKPSGENTMPDRGITKDGGGARLAYDPATLAFVDSGQRLGEADETISSDVALADLDNDQDLDAVVAVGYGGVSKVWLNDGNGNFTAGQDLAPISSSYNIAVALGDVDEDRDIDAIITCTDQTTLVWLNNGDGTFKPGMDFLVSAANVEIGHFNADEHWDVILAQANATVWLGNGNGRFKRTEQVIGKSKIRKFLIGDVDLDSDADVLIVSSSPRSHQLWLNDGNATFTEGWQGNESLRPLAMHDLNGDRAPDILCGVKNGNRVLLNDGNGQFVDTGPVMGVGECVGVGVGDLDQDGDPDFFAANGLFSETDTNNVVYLNDGKGTFKEAITFDLGTLSYNVALGDLDADGDLDVFETCREKGQELIWLNNLQAK